MYTQKNTVSGAKNWDAIVHTLTVCGKLPVPVPSLRTRQIFVCLIAKIVIITRLVPD